MGGTVAVIVSGNNALASIGASASVNAADVLVEAVSEERLLDVLASLSGAAGSSPTVAGTIGVLVSESETRAEVGDGALLRATAGSVTINANGEVKQIVVLAAATGGTGAAAVGATVNVNVFEHKVLALIGENAELIAEAMEAGSNVVITASAGDETIIVTVAGAGTTGAAGIAGAIPVIVSDSEVRASIGVAADIEAGDSVLVSADLITGLYDVAGGFAAGSTAGVGATVNTTVLENEVSATIADAARIIAHAIPASESGQAAGVPIPGRSERRRGVILRANADNRILLASMSGGAAGTAGVAGVVNTLVDKNTVRAAGGAIASPSSPALRKTGRRTRYLRVKSRSRQTTNQSYTTSPAASRPAARRVWAPPPWSWSTTRRLMPASATAASCAPAATSARTPLPMTTLSSSPSALRAAARRRSAWAPACWCSRTT